MHVYNELKGHPYGGFFIFKQPVVVLRDPELIKTIAVKDFEYFMDHRSIFSEDGEPVWSKGLFSLKGKEIHVYIFGFCAIYFLLIYIEESMYRPLRVCCNEFTGTPMEAPLDGIPVAIATQSYTYTLLVIHKSLELRTSRFNHFQTSI
jgi:hypothetical protein